MIPPCLNFVNHAFGVLVFLTLLLTSCEVEKEIVPEIYKPSSNHEAYLISLRQAGLLKTALGTDWQQASETAIIKPLFVESPYAEDFYLDPSEATAVGYRFLAKRGHKIEIDVSVEADDSIRIFLDVFRVDNDSMGDYTHIASASEHELLVGFEPNVDADYIMRLQPELLRGGRFRIQIQNKASLEFPVAGKNKSAIGSLFGAPRDAGKRKHHGVDIFAKRHTAIIAPTSGRVRSIKRNELGGNVIWLRDEKRDQTIYFAHLHDIFVDKGDYITVGDTIGTVGNTGNARTTAPHLHFGIYKSGPLDPYNFIVKPRSRFKTELADKSLISQTLRTKKVAKLKLMDIRRKGAQLSLPKHQILKSLGTSGAYYRVRMPDNTEGYISYTDVEKIDRPVKRQMSKSNNVLLSSPKATALKIDQVKEGSQISILGGNSDFYFVEQPNGQKGWIRTL